jgi:hypothetical protein
MLGIDTVHHRPRRSALLIGRVAHRTRVEERTLESFKLRETGEPCSVPDVKYHSAL